MKPIAIQHIEEQRRPSNANEPRLSLVVSTLNRTVELLRLFDSLANQTLTDFEVIVVDQNVDERLTSLLVADWPFAVTHLHRSDLKGISAGRNLGWQHAHGRVILFPDDDCWFAAGLLHDGLAEFDRLGAAILSGRAAAIDGRSINGRFARTARKITRRNVWTCQMEWITFIERSALEQLDGFDDAIGIGSLSPWQAAEGPDFILRALASGLDANFDPALSGYHDEIETIHPEPATVRKLRGYARGMGHVLAKHGCGLASILYWSARPVFNVARFAAIGQFARSRCYLSVAQGRMEGYFLRRPSPLK